MNRRLIRIFGIRSRECCYLSVLLDHLHEGGLDLIRVSSGEEVRTALEEVNLGLLRGGKQRDVLSRNCVAVDRVGFSLSHC